MWGLICYPLQCKGVIFYEYFPTFIRNHLFYDHYLQYVYYPAIYSHESVSLMDPGPELIEVIQNAYSSSSIYSPFISSYRKYYSRYGLVIFWALWICFLMIPEVIGTFVGALIIGVFKLISKICYKHKEG